jgi:hypothetical protein
MVRSFFGQISVSILVCSSGSNCKLVLTGIYSIPSMASCPNWNAYVFTKKSLGSPSNAEIDSDV